MLSLLERQIEDGQKLVAVASIVTISKRSRDSICGILLSLIRVAAGRYNSAARFENRAGTARSKSLEGEAIARTPLLLGRFDVMKFDPFKLQQSIAQRVFNCGTGFVRQGSAKKTIHHL